MALLMAQTGHLLYHLCVDTMENYLEIGNGPIRVVFDPNDGMTVRSVCYRGFDIVVADDVRKAEGATYAIPVLFPTPNRVDEGFYVYDGRRIEGMMHGFLRHEKFKVDCLEKDRVVAHVDFDGNNVLFPYKGSFYLTLQVSENSLHWHFSVIDSDSVGFAYSLALHPFFTKDSLLKIKVDTAREMKMRSDKIPTGETVAVPHLELAKDEIDMDTVFMTDGSFHAELIYRDFVADLSASSDFQHVVVYSSPDKNFVCVEPQTGSTDAHNLHAKGFVKEAALVEVASGDERESCFTIEFHPTRKGE